MSRRAHRSASLAAPVVEFLSLVIFALAVVAFCAAFGKL